MSELHSVTSTTSSPKRMPWEMGDMLLAINLYDRNLHWRDPKHRRALIEGTPAVKELATLLRRTPSAVVARLWQIVGKDPRPSTTAVTKGIPTSENSYVKRAWEQYITDRAGSEALMEATLSRLADSSAPAIAPSLGAPDGGSRLTRVKARVGQEKFRENVLWLAGRKCIITDCADTELLEASHIKPWNACTPAEKTNAFNGICLNRLHHKAFDLGYWTITPRGKVMVSQTHLQEEDTATRFILGVAKIESVPVFSKAASFFEYHNDAIFKG